MESLRRQLDQEEDRELRQGRHPPHAVTASVFVGNGLRIEQQQYVPTTFYPFNPADVSPRRDVRLKQQEAIKAKTVAGGLVDSRKLLVNDIQEFRAIQKVYMPGLSHLVDDVEDDSRLITRPELFKLMLPSQLSPAERKSWCLPDLTTLEARFRYAQADDALAEIRRLRQLFQGLSDQTRKHITNSQGTGTRSHGTFDWYKAQISQSATVY